MEVACPEALEVLVREVLLCIRRYPRLAGDIAHANRSWSRALLNTAPSSWVSAPRPKSNTQAVCCI
eukprot:3933575-Rhodomonas_salina.4